jgi:hypothetical protein
MTWNAFPEQRPARSGRQRAAAEADAPGAYQRQFFHEIYSSATTGHFLSGKGFFAKTFCRRQVEYCEWYVICDQPTGRIPHVTFTPEPLEYGIAMFGGPFLGRAEEPIFS